MFGKYTALFHDGFPSGGTLPDAPSDDNTFPSLSAIEHAFRTWLTASGNDYVRGDGYGSPACFVYLTESYDGIAYGDYPHAAFELGPRCGVVRASL